MPERKSCRAPSPRPIYRDSWLASRRASIEGGRSNKSAINEISVALPMLANYQEFRLRSARLGEKERFALSDRRNPSCPCCFRPT